MITKGIRNIIVGRLNKPFSAPADYYSLLGLKRTASSEEIKSAYVSLAKVYHPDINGDALGDRARLFQQISEAFACLSSPSKKFKYDRDSLAGPGVFLDEVQEVRAENGIDVKRQQRMARTDYAEEYRAMIRQERERFNLSDLGTFKGGSPASRRGKNRGTGLQEIGVFGKPYDIRNKQSDHMAELHVDEAVVDQFKNYKDYDKEALKNQWTWWRVSVDYDFKPVAEHTSLFRNLRVTLLLTMLSFGWIYAYQSQIADLGKELKNDGIAKKVEHVLEGGSKVVSQGKQHYQVYASGVVKFL